MAEPRTPPPTGNDPRPGKNPGYPEKQPRTPGDAREDGAEPPCNPDEGGLGRAPETTPD